MMWFQKIRERREELGLSQAELAKEIDISQAAINKIENGGVSRSRFLPRIAKRLGIPLGDLDPDYKIVHSQKTKSEIFETQVRLFDGSLLRDQSGDTPLVLCSSVRDDEMWLENEAFQLIQRPSFLKDNEHVMAVLVTSSVMYPEISDGDIVFCTSKWGAMEGSTCIFVSKEYKSPKARLCKIGIITAETDNAWHIKVWNAKKRDENTEILQINEWYNPNRIVAKYYAGWSTGDELAERPDDTPLP